MNFGSISGASQAARLVLAVALLAGAAPALAQDSTRVTRACSGGCPTQASGQVPEQAQAPAIEGQVTPEIRVTRVVSRALAATVIDPSILAYGAFFGPVILDWRDLVGPQPLIGRRWYCDEAGVCRLHGTHDVPQEAASVDTP